jgi:hypothetical protein
MRRPPALLLAAILTGTLFDDGEVRAQAPATARFEVASLKERDPNVPLGPVTIQKSQRRTNGEIRVCGRVETIAVVFVSSLLL